MPHSLRGVHPLGCQMVSRSLSPLSMETMARVSANGGKKQMLLGEREGEKKKLPPFPKSRPLIGPRGCVQTSSSCSVNRQKIIYDT